MQGCLDPMSMTTTEWERLAAEVKLFPEDWGEGWLRIRNEYRGAKVLTRETALSILRQLAEATRAKEMLLAAGLIHS
jgi:hypothetical protein